MQESFAPLLRALRGRDHLVKLLVLQSDIHRRGEEEGDEGAPDLASLPAASGSSGDSVAADSTGIGPDGALVEGACKDMVEEIVKRFAKIPEVMLLTGGRPGVEMTCGQLWDAERKLLGLSQVQSALHPRTHVLNTTLLLHPTPYTLRPPPWTLSARPNV